MNIEVKHPEGTPIDRDPHPIVVLPRRGAPGAMIAALLLVAAVLLFVTLDAQRRRLEAASAGDEMPATAYTPPPPLSIPAEPIAQTQVTPVMTIQPIARAPAFAPAPVTQQPVQPMPPFQPFYRPLPAQPRPIGVADNQRPATTTDPALVIDAGTGEMPVGTLIPAVLETPIDTARPGQVRAIVALDARGHDGQRVLVPRGSRLIGEYQSDARPGQNRVLVNWTRLIRPDGTAIRLGVPSADAMGGAGIPGKGHSFFLARFFDAALQTALSLGGNLAGGRASSTVILGLPGALGGGAGQGLTSSDSHRPTVTVKSGTLFNVFVARDIDFSGASPAQ